MKRSETGLLLFIICCAIAYCIFLQFISPAFYESDSYYHASVIRAIKESGLRHKFPWAVFSVQKDLFADKDLLFHLLGVPFLYLTGDIVVAGKYAVIFYNIVFIMAYVFVLRKYLPGRLAGYFLLLPFLSVNFTSYMLALRSFTLANILTLLGVYFLINKKAWGVFIAAMLYALTHTSFITILIFAVACEIIRYLFNKEFFFKNIYAAAIGILAGCFIHPGFPNNLLYTHLCYVVLDYIGKGVNIGFGEELFSFATKRVLTENFALFFGLNIVLWMALLSRVRMGFATAVWAACANFYVILSFGSDRHWYPANMLFFVFFASYLKDWMEARQAKGVSARINIFVALYLAAAAVFLPAGLKTLKNTIVFHTKLDAHYREAAVWMKQHIPPGETIYHSYWNESAYFICFNPANNYIIVFDPVYMFYRYPQEYLVYRDVSEGGSSDPYAALKDIFKVRYGYTRKDNPLYPRVRSMPDRFAILYEDYQGIVFALRP